MLVKREGVAVAGDRVHAAGQGHAHTHDAVPVQAVFVHVLADAVRNLVHGFFVGLHSVEDIVLERDETAFEVGDGNTDMPVADVYAHKVPGLRIETVDGRSAAAGSAGLAKVYHESLVHQFPDEFGSRGNGCADGLADGGNAVFPALDAEEQDVLFQEGVLVVFFVKEGLSHKIFIFSRQI